MSLLPNQTNINLDTYFFLRGTGQSLTVSTLNANTIFTNSITASQMSTNTLDAEYINNSTINTLYVDLDGQILTASPTELLLNGIPLATTSNLSSIADWSLDPAISTVQMQGNNLLGAGAISTNSIVGNTAFFTNLMALNSMFLSTYTSTISSYVTAADSGYFSTISTGVLTGRDITCSTLNVGTFISTPDIEVSSINGAQFGNSSITVEIVGVSSLVANSISSIGAELRNALVSTLQFKPEFKIEFNLGLEELGQGIKAGLTNLGLEIGGGLAVVGTGLIAAATARGSNTTIVNNTFEQYSQPTQLQFSTLGTNTDTYIRYVSSSGAGNVIPGTEVIVSSIIPAGTLCIRSIGDPINLVDPSTYTSSIQSYGNWVIHPEVPSASTISSFSDIYTSSIAASTLVLNGASPITWQQTALSQLGGVSAGAYTQLAGVEFWTLGGPSDTNYGVYSRSGANRALYTDSNLIPHNLLYTSDSNATISSLTVSSINNAVYPLPTISTFQTLQTSSIYMSTATVEGQIIINPSTLRSGVWMPYDATNGTGVLAIGLSTSVSIYENYSAILGATGRAFGQPANETMAVLNTSDNEVSFQFADFDVGRLLVAGNVNYGANPSAFLEGDVLANLAIVANSINLSTISTFANGMYTNTLSTAALTVSSINNLPPPFAPVVGAFISLSTQIVTAANTPLPICYDTAELAIGGVNFSTTAVVIPAAGTYEIGTSIQLDQTGGGTNSVDFWFRKNGVDIPNTASQTTVVGNQGEVLATVSIFSDLAANDKIEIILASPEPTMSAKFFQSTVTTPYTRPAIPSIITNVKRLV